MVSQRVQFTEWSDAHIAGQPARGTVVSAEGRAIKRDGLPLAYSTVIESSDHPQLDFRFPGAHEDDPWTYTPWLRIDRQDFDRCPICLSAGELTKEHVPPARLGGSVLTLTCKRCNNVYGGFEDGLLARVEHRATMHIQSAALPGGEARVKNVIVRQAENSAYMMSTWNGWWPPHIGEVIEGLGQFRYRFEHPCDCVVYVAIVKSAYLAACVALGRIPEPETEPVATAVREQLLRWRDSDDPHLKTATHFNDLHVRYNAPIREDSTVTLCEATHLATGMKREVLRMGSQLVIDWPIDAAQIAMTPDGSVRVVVNVDDKS
ncbi:hypothetical protein SAMN06309944_1984 [Micrococcales bacterium KH10]|nr:hypothetical protein SAMN06309944_1984 [Micrococcales bacterium KH10]